MEVFFSKNDNNNNNKITIKINIEKTRGKASCFYTSFWKIVQ